MTKPVCRHLKLATENLELREAAGVTEQDALQKGMEEKSREFTEKGSELYAKA